VLLKLNKYKDNYNYFSKYLRKKKYFSYTFFIYSDANKRLHDTNGNLRDALDQRTSVIKQMHMVSSFVTPNK